MFINYSAAASMAEDVRAHKQHLTTKMTPNGNVSRIEPLPATDSNSRVVVISNDVGRNSRNGEG